MILPWWINGGSLLGPWCFHRDSVVFPWWVHGASMALVWFLHSTLIVSPLGQSSMLIRLRKSVHIAVQNALR